MSIWERLGGIQGKATVVLIAVFLAGGGTGYFAGRWHTMREFSPDPDFRQARFKRPDDQKKYDFMQRLENDLRLGPDQRERVRATLREHHARMREIRRQMRPQVQGVLQQARQEIRVLLNPEQQQIFDQMVREFDARRRDRRERWERRRMMRERGMMHKGGR